MNWANYDDVLRQLRDIGLDVPVPLELARPDGRSRRCYVEGDRSEKRGWYRLHEWQYQTGIVLLVGSYGIFHGASSTTYKVELSKTCRACHADVPLAAKVCPACRAKTFTKRELSDEQKAAFRAKMAEDRKRAAAEAAREAAIAARWATAVWRISTEAVAGGHPYLVRKRLTGTGGARIFPGNAGVVLDGAGPEDYKRLATFTGHLVVPLCDQGGQVHGLQFVAPARDAKTGHDKMYWPRNMAVEGHYWLIGSSPQRLCLIAEGFATAQTLHEATGHPVAVAFAANNLLPVAGALLARTRRRAKLLVCADDDWLQRCPHCKIYTKVELQTCSHCGLPHAQFNTGVLRATDISMVIDVAEQVRPVFAAERPSDRKSVTDFNDLAMLEGPQVVAAQIEARLQVLGWEEAAATPPPVSSLTAASARSKGSGEYVRRDACSVLALDDAVDRFVPLDDGTGDYVFDTWTRKIAQRKQMIALLPAGVRADDVKRHDVWLRRGACYIDQVGFDPTEKDASVLLNTWRGWPLLPKAGDCEKLLELIEYLCSAEDNASEVYRWLLCWMAYPLQRPGAKMDSAVIMHGPQGTGKSTVFQAYSEIYGDYATVLNQRGLEDKFNSDWSDSKLLILAEEVVNRAEMWHIKNELKELVTGKWIRINPKNIAAYRQRNQVNLIYLSNEDQPLPLDNDDRRHLVIYTPPLQPESYYDAVHSELANGGVQAFYHYLLHLDLSSWHPKKRPPMTTSKERLIELSSSSDMRFVAQWANGELDLPVVPCLSGDLYQAYQRWCRVNGESRPRPSNHFHGAVSRLPGWDKRKCRIYPTPSALETVPRPLIFPPQYVLEKSGSAQPPGTSPTKWLTDCVSQFSNALNEHADGSGWRNG